MEQPHAALIPYIKDVAPVGGGKLYVGRSVIKKSIRAEKIEGGGTHAH